MRALVICPQIGTEAELGMVDALWASYDVRVAVDGGADHVVACGLLPDIVIGDLDSIQACTLAELTASAVEVVRANPDKDVSDLDLALDWCRARGVKTVSILGALGGRSDHFLAVCGSLVRNADISPRLESDKEQIIVVSSVTIADGSVKPERLSVSYPGAIFSVLGLQGDVVVSISGARWCLDFERLSSLSSHGLSNQVSESCAEIVVWEGRALVIVNT